MAPFIVLIALFGFFYVLGSVWLPAQFDWLTSLRLALAGMFLLTASAHWGKRRQDLIAMVPPAFPRPDLLVTMTGVLEITGAVGLMLPIAAPYAALGLCFMLLAVFPANVHAARQHLSIAGRPVEALFPRALLQLVFLAATATVFAAGKRLTKHLAPQRLTFREVECRRPKQGALIVAGGLGEVVWSSQIELLTTRIRLVSSIRSGS